jgi:hypothetical protein
MRFLSSVDTQNGSGDHPASDPTGKEQDFLEGKKVEV